jgi:uncharacterized UBP type Zn finger protein
MVFGKSKKSCEHVLNVTENVTPKTAGCEECEKEGTDWVALRLCLSCGHVGCCDSSVGRHATKHYKETGHPVMIALPNKPWKWCYVHEIYA